MCLKPHWFGIHHVKEAGLLILLVLIYTIIIPIIGILLLRFIGLIKTIHLEDKMDRIAPLIICIVFYLWLYINLKQNRISQLEVVSNMGIAAEFISEEPK